MTNRDRFSRFANFIVQSLGLIIFVMSIAILFVVMFITLPDDVEWTDMIKQPENYALIIVTISLNIQSKLLGSSLIKSKYYQSNEYQFSEKLDGKTTGDLLKNQHQFIRFNATRTINNREAAQFEYLSGFGYKSIDELRAAANAIKPTYQQYKLSRRKNKYAKETYELHDLYKRYKKAPRILRHYKHVKYTSTVIHKTFWNYITQSTFRKGRRVLESYRPTNKLSTVFQTVLMSLVTSILAIQSFKFGYDPSKLPVFVAMLSTIGTNFLTSIILTLLKLKEIPAFVKNKFRELNEFRAASNLPEATYLEETAKELTQQILEEREAEKERERLKREQKAAKMTEDTKIALAKEANRKAELELRRIEAINKRTELELARKENKAFKLVKDVTGGTK